MWLFMGISACQKAPELSIVELPNNDYSADGGSLTLSFKANRDWAITTSDSWVTVSPSKGTATDGVVTVTVRCEANTTYDDRYATVTITMEELSQTASICQLAKNGLVVPTQTFNLSSKAETIVVEVNSNVKYTVTTSADWIKHRATRSLTTNKLYFEIDQNSDYDPREGTITIKPENGTIPEQVISIKQAQKDALKIKVIQINVRAAGGDSEIEVESNVPYEVIPSVDWIHYVATKTLSTSTIRFNFDANPTNSIREGIIQIRQKDGSLSHNIKVIQDARIEVTSLSLNRSSLYMKLGETETLKADVEPWEATDKTIIWSSSDPTVASVDDTGTITALKEGSSIIQVQCGNCKQTCFVWVHNAPTGAVDLGIVVTREDGTTYKLYWSSSEVLSYVAWGETQTKSNYSQSSYKWMSNGKITKYCLTKDKDLWGGYGNPDGKTVLDLEDDPAHVKLGGKWRTPTKEEMDALIKQCTWEAYYGTLKATSKVNGMSIRFPSNGYKNGEGITDRSRSGRYWTSTLASSNRAYIFGFKVEDTYKDMWLSDSPRYLGYSILPVTE